MLRSLIMYDDKSNFRFVILTICVRSKLRACDVSCCVWAVNIERRGLVRECVRACFVCEKKKHTQTQTNVHYLYDVVSCTPMFNSFILQVLETRKRKVHAGCYLYTR